VLALIAAGDLMRAAGGWKHAHVNVLDVGTMTLAHFTAWLCGSETMKAPV